MNNENIENRNAGAYVAVGYKGSPSEGTVKRKMSRISLWRAGNFLAELALKYLHDAGDVVAEQVSPEDLIPVDKDFLECLLTEWKHLSTARDSENTGSWMHFSHNYLKGVHLLYDIRQGSAKLILPSEQQNGWEAEQCVDLIGRFRTDFSAYVKKFEIFE